MIVTIILIWENAGADRADHDAKHVHALWGVIVKLLNLFFSKVYWKWCQTWTCSRKNIKIYVFKVESVYQISKDIHQREISSFYKYDWRCESQSSPVPGISSSRCHKRGWIAKPLTQDRCYGQSPTCLSFVTNAIRIILNTDPTNLIYLQRLRESFQSLFLIYLSPASLTEARSRKVIENLNLRGVWDMYILNSDHGHP